MGHLSWAMPNWMNTGPQFWTGVPVMLPFPTDPPRNSRRKVAAQKRLNFSQTSYRLTRGFLMFFIAYSIVSKSNSPVKKHFHHANSDFSLEETYFQTSWVVYSTHQQVLKEVLHPWIQLIRLKLVISLRFMANFVIRRDHFAQWEKFISIFYDMFRGNSDQNSHLPCNKAILIHLW